MKCPHCKKELKLANNNAYANAEVYGNTNYVLTKCCKNIAVIKRKISFETNVIDKNKYHHTHDDWGNEIPHTQVEEC